MKKIILGLLLLFMATVYSQKNQIHVFANEKQYGKNFVDNSEIYGLEYVFPDRIHDIFLDTITGFLTVQTRGLSKDQKWLNNNGNIIQYDVKNQKVLWSKKIAYHTSNLQQYEQTMIYTAKNKSYCLDINNGNELWEVKNNIYLVNPINNIGMGYKFKNSTGYTNDLEGIDLKNGNILWKRNLNREYGWNDVFYINDSTMIVVAAGLHAININTGKGWDYNTITGKKDYSGNAVANAFGVAAGLLTGTYAISTGHNLVRDLTSNTVIDSSSIYFASKEQLAKIDKQSGEVVWKYPFPNDIASKSSIHVNDSVVFMLNKGMAFMGARQLDFGKPFLAAFDRQTGKQIFFSVIDVKDDPILSSHIQNQDIFLVFKNRILKYSMATGIKSIEKDFPKESFGELKHFIGNQVFITAENGDLLNLRQSTPTQLYVFTTKDKALSLDENLNLTKTIEHEDLSINYQRIPNFKFIAKDKNTFIINGEGKKVAEVEAMANAFLIDKTLYNTQDNSFIMIDLNKILTNK